MRVATAMVLAAIGSVCALGACGDERFPTVFPDAGAPPIDSGFAPLEPSPPPRTASAALRDASSSPVVFDALRGGVWTANGDAGSVSYVDVDARKVAQEIAVGKDIRSVALSPDARWVAAVDRDAAAVSLIDAETREVKKTLAVGTHPRAAVWDAFDPRWLYVAIEDDDGIAIIDRTLGVVARTVKVGRIPSGLAVSRQRRELYVTHRIDARVTVVSLEGVYTPADQNAELVEIGLADEAATEGDPKVPNGKPFAFESLAFAADGNVAWLPHQLFAPTHPFQFQTTLFPAISVVDLGARLEVKTDPADPNGAIAGRKNLFAAINLIDQAGNPHVVSQPCAAVLHPNGFIGYALACASEDLLTFDVKSGLAVDILRNLPGDHPAGMALDDTGQRLFVIADQSHSLVTLDTASGSLLEHAKLYGSPIALAAKDPVDAKMREGLKLFFRANSSKGDLATTGNNWMSCGGCHLDGFVSTNQALFEMSKVVNPTKDANIGHEGLKDLFSTAPTPDTVDPHDILVAFNEQAGLAPDRTGASRAGAIDPNGTLPQTAVDMAKNIARVIQRDLPIGPTWLLPGDPPPNADNDGAWCGNCHKLEYDAWSKSVHAHSSVDPMLRYGVGVEQKLRGPQYSRLCAGCHDPVSARLGDVSLNTNRGVTCLGCHDMERPIRAGGNGDLEAKTHAWEVDHKENAKAALVKLRDPAFCGGCHQQFVPGTGLEAISTHREWSESTFAGGQTPATPCVSCHAPKLDNGSKDHAMIGGNVYMAKAFGDQAMVDAETANLAKAVEIAAATRDGTNVKITVANYGAGHSFPTGVTDIREPWVEVQALDAGNKVVARFGGPDANGLIPANAARLGIDIAKADGTVLLLHELSETQSIPFDVRIPAGGERDFTVPVPASLPSGATKWSAVLLYRNVRTPYYRAATGQPQSSAPEIEVAREEVP